MHDQQIAKINGSTLPLTGSDHAVFTLPVELLEIRVTDFSRRNFPQLNNITQPAHILGLSNVTRLT